MESDASVRRRKRTSSTDEAERTSWKDRFTKFTSVTLCKVDLLDQSNWNAPVCASTSALNSMNPEQEGIQMLLNIWRIFPFSKPHVQVQVELLTVRRKVQGSQV
ncbi:hypothetical protein P5673_003132 [Acropora cervicornis]|uniref:Uncharacterized protein n=1 Tax=Acropora cervicornis TaxID=6130 RepID=A0AAD9R294_ACRCE|nr:hypothetical protein P5673_003132 [Acropora cervicornis]